MQQLATQSAPSASQPDPSATLAAFVRVEAAALSALAVRLDREMRPAIEQALDILIAASAGGHRLIVTGMGKSGIIGRKIAATLRSTGSPAHFLHPAEALHGDLGMVSAGDVALALSYSGETEELLRLLPALERSGVSVIAFCSCATSSLAKASTAVLDVSVSAEACSLNLAPTASTTVMLALGDALALELARRRGFEPEHFADLHPGGRLGQRLARVRDLMHAGEALPQVPRSTLMPAVIHEMSSKRLGMTTVLDSAPDGSIRLAGIISDGDLRRLLERVGPQALESTASDIMNPHPVTISGDSFASDALRLMEERKITSLVVLAAEDREAASPSVAGVVHLHDLWQTQPF